MSSSTFVLPDLKDGLPHPKTPWHVGPNLVLRLLPSNSIYKEAVIHESDPEHAFIQKYFCANKPDGYGISKIIRIYNTLQTTAFVTELQIMELDDNKFPARWKEENHNKEREIALKNWKILSEYFSPIEIQPDEEHTNTLTCAKVLPMWHGSSNDKTLSICSTGFTYFGKHHFFHPSARQGTYGSTDSGYFGSGIYFTSNAKYATLYSEGGHLLLSLVSMREPYPVISDIPHRHPFPKCTDMQILEGKGSYQTYNAHYIPVASLNPNSPLYYPCYSGQLPDADELVVFSRSQTLPCFWVQLSVDTPSPLFRSYTLDSLHTAAYTGEKKVLQTWIQEDRRRLLTKSDKGESLWYTAIRGNQFEILQWLHTMDPNTLSLIDDNGSTLLHLSCALGHLEIVKWLYKQDSTQFLPNNQKFTPLHLAAFNERLTVLDLFLDRLPLDILSHLVTRHCPKSLAYLLDKGLPIPTNSDKQTLLHLAAQSAQEENVIVLLDHKFDINDQDLQGRTPLYLATLQGHRSIAQLLISRGAHVETCSNVKDTVLHVAAFYGYVQLLQDFLKDPVCVKLLSSKDHDGKIPLHSAVWGSPTPEIVQLILENGVDPNCVNDYIYTPLHWAAKNGHVESAKILLQHNSLFSENFNGDNPFDLALDYQSDLVVHLFLDTQKRLAPVPLPPKLNEEFYFKQLLQAKKENLVEEQVLYLSKISDHYRDRSQTNQQKNLLEASKFLNSALAILEKSEPSHPLFENSLLKRLEKIEKLFLESYDIDAKPHTLTTYRQHLKTARKACEAASLNPIKSLFYLTEASKHLLKTFINDGIHFFGNPPTPWAAIGMGSMARGEMCPYSNIKFAFLLKIETPEGLSYFRKLSYYLQLRIINLGETTFNVFGESEPSPTPTGFCMNIGVNTPLGVKECYELISTPNQLAQFQKWMEKNIILTNILNCVCFLAGDEKLVGQYEKEKEIIGKQRTSFNFMKDSTFYNLLALRLLRAHLTEFESNLSVQKEKEDKAFNIKKELYRPLQEVLNSLALLFNVNEKSSVGKIEKLTKLGLFSSEGAKNLKNTFEQVLALRLRAHLFYTTEQEFLFRIESEKPQDPTKLYLNDELLGELQAIYRVIMPFHHCVKEFMTTKKKESLCTNHFYDESPLTQGKAYQKTLQYEKAKEAFQQAVTLNPNDTHALLWLGKIKFQLGNTQEALVQDQQTLEITRRKYGENHADVATCYNNIGLAHNALGRVEEGLEFLQKGFKIWFSLNGENHLDVGTSYNNIGDTLRTLGRVEEGLEFLKKGLKVWLSLYGEYHPTVATSYHNIGMAHNTLGRVEEGLEFLQKGHKIWLSLYGENHPDVALSYNNIGSVIHALGRVEEGLESLQKGLRIWRTLYGENHPGVATSYNDIGDTLRTLGRVEEGIEFFQKGLKVWIALYGENHPNVALSKRNIELASHPPRVGRRAKGSAEEGFEFL